MAFLEDKIDEIRDPELRRTILQEVKKLKSEKSLALFLREYSAPALVIHHPLQKCGRHKPYVGRLGRLPITGEICDE